jgi:hypothetical protein
LCESRSMVHMPTANSVEIPDRGSGMAHLGVYRAADVGKHLGNNDSRAVEAAVRRLIFAAFALFAVFVSGSASYAQSGPFTGMAGNWSGGGTVTLDDGSTERLRCRAAYAVSPSGTGLNQTLTCASDSYKFNLASNVVSEGGSLSGTWSESNRNASGTLQGRGSNGNFQVVASGPGLTANISLTTHGNKQSVVIKTETAFRTAAITLSRN